eukprot:ANDGO_01171.mRNA.1 hypothetical protein
MDNTHGFSAADNMTLHDVNDNEHHPSLRQDVETGRFHGSTNPLRKAGLDDHAGQPAEVQQSSAVTPDQPPLQEILVPSHIERMTKVLSADALVSSISERTADAGDGAASLRHVSNLPLSQMPCTDHSGSGSASYPIDRESGKFQKLEYGFRLTMVNRTAYPVRVNVFVRGGAMSRCQNCEFIILPQVPLLFELDSAVKRCSRIVALVATQGWQRASCTDSDVLDRAQRSSCFGCAMSVTSFLNGNRKLGASTNVEAAEAPRIRMRLYSLGAYFNRKLFEGISEQHADRDNAVLNAGIWEAIGNSSE